MKFAILFTCVAALFLMGALGQCGSPDVKTGDDDKPSVEEGDDSTAGDDFFAGDDQGDDATSDECRQAITILYETCALTFITPEGDRISMDTAISRCSHGEAYFDCAVACITANPVCADIKRCILDQCYGDDDTTDDDTQADDTADDDVQDDDFQDDDIQDDDMTDDDTYYTCDEVVTQLYSVCEMSFGGMDDVQMLEWCGQEEDFMNQFSAKTSSPAWNCLGDCSFANCDQTCMDGCLDPDNSGAGGCAATVDGIYGCGIGFCVDVNCAYQLFEMDVAQICDLMDNPWDCMQNCVDSYCPADSSGAISCLSAC